ncbi:MAG: flagellar biosynthetic protein FliR [Verrucomicrobiota bacterium]
MNWTLDIAQFWIVGSRLSGMLLMIPAIGQVALPTMLRVAITMWLTFALMNFVPSPGFAMTDAFEFTVAIGFEFLLGMGIGYVVRLAFAIVEIGGTILDTELSFHAAAQFDPTTAVSSGPIGRMLILVSLLYFWLLDYLPIMIMALRESFILVPPFAFNMPMFNLESIVKVSAGIFTGGLIMAAPVMALLFAVNVGFGLIAKSVPGMNFFFEVFVIRILAGLVGMILFLPLILLIIREQFARIIPLVSVYLQGVIVK